MYSKEINYLYLNVISLFDSTVLWFDIKPTVKLYVKVECINI